MYQCPARDYLILTRSTEYLIIARPGLRSQNLSAVLGLVLYEVFTGKRPSNRTRCLRYLEAEPRNRPASALAVAAVLPGGDPLAVGMFVNNLRAIVPVTVRPSAWYFGSTLFMLASVVALTAWAFHASMAGRRLWKQDLFR